ncbi:MAG: hypothetical protein AAGA48_11595 [Myxococcota bacterium]
MVSWLWGSMLFGCGPPLEVTAAGVDSALERINSAFVYLNESHIEFEDGRRRDVAFAQVVLSDRTELCDEVAKTASPLSREADVVVLVINWIQRMNRNDWLDGRFQSRTELSWNDFLAGPERDQTYVEAHYLERVDGRTTAFYGTRNAVDEDVLGFADLQGVATRFSDDDPTNLRGYFSGLLEVDRLAPDGWDLDLDGDGTPDHRSIEANLDASFRAKPCRNEFILLGAGFEDELPKR